MAQDEKMGAQPAAEASRIGKSLAFRGDLSGGEDLVIEGRFAGKIDLGNRDLVIQEEALVEAEVHARSVTVNGELLGDAYAAEKMTVSESGRMKGDISASTVSIFAGAQFRGSIRMKKPLP
jgi:cytoskeletal protein CcmA (bactofilin family)